MTSDYRPELSSQINSNTPSKRAIASGKHWLAAAAAMLALVVGVKWLYKAPPVDVQIEMARMAVADATDARILDARGYVVARRVATLASKVTARVEAVLVEEGQQIQQGQVIARLNVDNTRKSLELAQAELLAAKARVEEVRAHYSEAKLNLERNTELARQQLVSIASLDKARADFAAINAQLEARKADVEVAQKQLALQQQSLDDLTLRAPFAGVVVSKDAQVGEMISPVSAGGGFTRTGICTLVDMGSLEVEAKVGESVIQRVRPEQYVQVTLDAYPDWQIPARVIAIIPTADRKTAAVKVRIALQQQDVRILPDMSLRVAFYNTQPEMPTKARAPLGIRVPTSAVRSDGEDKYIFVVKDGVAERRKVNVAASYGSDMYISAGLKPGEDFVVTVSPALKDGARVRY